MLDDGLDAHLAAVALAFESEPIDQTDRVSMQRVDFQPLLGLGPTLFGGGDPVADRRQSTIPEALPGVLLPGACDVLAVLLRLVFVEERNDPPHHVMDRVIPSSSVMAMSRTSFLARLRSYYSMSKRERASCRERV